MTVEEFRNSNINCKYTPCMNFNIVDKFSSSRRLVDRFSNNDNVYIVPKLLSATL